jgi:hypothetical protein
VQKYKPPIFDVWEEAALEAAVKVVEKDPQLAEYEARDEAALAVTVEAFAADERQRGACSGALGHKSWLFCRFSCTSLVVFWHRCKRKSRTLRNQEQNTSSSAGAYATFAFDFFSAHTRRRFAVDVDEKDKYHGKKALVERQINHQNCVQGTAVVLFGIG